MTDQYFSTFRRGIRDRDSLQLVALQRDIAGSRMACHRQVESQEVRIEAIEHELGRRELLTGRSAAAKAFLQHWEGS